jgi:spore cortex biosynthesis protein YabQ
MQFFISEQINIFLMAILCGVIIAVLNEIFRFLRYIGFNSNTTVFIQDIVFMSIAAFISFCFALCFNKGDVRLFILLAEFSGFLAFRYTIGLFTGKLFKGLHFIINKLSQYIKTLFNALSTILDNIVKYILVKIPLFKNSKETSCQKGDNYCIILKSVFRFTKAFKKR